MMTKVIGGILRVVKGKERGKRIARSSHMMMIMMILPGKSSSSSIIFSGW